jgi:pyruvate dehydrogenase E2 component (dihydrolipoyllysine-residue acetyltransferase)
MSPTTGSRDRAVADLVMPRLSDSMEEGTVLRWLKADGESVRRGEDLVEIETDKATMTHQSDLDGVLQIVASEGDTLPIGAVIAHVGDSAAANGSADAPAVTAPTERPSAPGPATGAPAGSGAPPHAAPGAPAPQAAPATATAARVRASPVARRIARELGVDLTSLSGSGPGGRIVKADVHTAADGPPAPQDDDLATAGDAPPPERVSAPTPSAAEAASPAAAAPADDTGTGRGQVTPVELSRIQQLVARRMAESRATVPDFTIQTEVDMEGCVTLRGELKELTAAPAPTYNDMVVRACALALREFPRANGSYRDGHFELHSRVNVGVAVAARDALIVPTVFDADVKSLLTIARETRELAERVRSATVTPPQLSGATFTVSNLGMFGITSFTAVINPPQAAILSVGSMAQRAVVRERALVARHTMHMTLACDHRILYGAEAAEFLARVRALLERPLALAFDTER